MKRFDKALIGVEQDHRRENYIGPLTSTKNGGRMANVNNLNKSELRDVQSVMPYGISSRAGNGIKAQTVVNNHDDNVVVGVYDNKRPNVEIGEIMLYSIGKCKVYLTKDGKITIQDKLNHKIVLDDISLNIIYDLTKSIKMTDDGIEIKDTDYKVLVKNNEIELSNINGNILIDGTHNQIKYGDNVLISMNDGTLLARNETSAVLMSESSGITMSNGSYNVTIPSDGNISVTGNGASIVMNNGDVKINCTNLIVNDQAMIIP